MIIKKEDGTSVVVKTTNGLSTVVVENEEIEKLFSGPKTLCMGCGYILPSVCVHICKDGKEYKNGEKTTK